MLPLLVKLTESANYPLQFPCPPTHFHNPTTLLCTPCPASSQPTGPRCLCTPGWTPTNTLTPSPNCTLAAGFAGCPQGQLPLLVDERGASSLRCGVCAGGWVAGLCGRCGLGAAVVAGGCACPGGLALSSVGCFASGVSRVLTSAELDALHGCLAYSDVYSCSKLVTLCTLKGGTD
jgi:hypothetical protein